MSSKPPGLFITGTDTGVGKTYVAALIARELTASGVRVGVYKPVASGCRREGGTLVSDDAVALWIAAGRPGTLDHVCPQCFAAPLAPPLAARVEKKNVNAALLRSGIEFWRESADFILVEGAGGLLAPLSDSDYVADLALEFGYPLVIVARNALGVINQTLQTLHVARTYRGGLSVAGVVLNNPLCSTLDDISLATNHAELAARCDCPILRELPHGAAHFNPRVDWLAHRSTGFQPVIRMGNIATVSANTGKMPLQRGTGFQPALLETESTGKMPVLQDFDPDADFEAPRRNLPHWRQAVATYFVTFRLADSLPQEKLRQLRYERAQWLKLNPHPRSPQAIAVYRSTFSKRIEEFLASGYGACWLRQTDIGAIVETALQHFDNERYDLGRYVVMPNHVHVLVQPRADHELPDILHSWKSYTANQINRAIGRQGVLWQDESFDRVVRNAEEYSRLEIYIDQNPIDAKLSEGEFRLGGRRL